MAYNEKDIITHLKSLEDLQLLDKTLRALGRTTRICDELVQRFFNAPYGEWIPVIDHYGTRQADEMLLEKFMKRMKLEHPSVEIECDKRRRVIVVRRKNKTYQELAREEIDRRNAKNNE